MRPWHLIVVGAVLAVWGFVSHWPAPGRRLWAARCRLLIDLATAGARLLYLAVLLFSPRHVKPNSRRRPARSRGLFSLF